VHWKHKQAERGGSVGSRPHLTSGQMTKGQFARPWSSGLVASACRVVRGAIAGPICLVCKYSSIAYFL
jgi:hypothetical protein